MQRKLAAILAADVVGYSRLIAEDEARTLDALRALRRESFEPLVAEHRGEVVKRMGDGWLVSFGSVVDAAACAIAVQEQLTGHDRIKLRIGVHLGNIVHEDEDIFGDGVNIAARLQEVVEPGGVLISGISYESLVGRLDSEFEDAGEQSLKNIARPVRAWRWGGGIEPLAAPPLSPDAPLPLPDKPSIAVLPFANMSNDPEQEFLADGLAEDVTTALSKFSSLFVIARTSTFSYKSQNVPVAVIARDLGVRYIVEGSIRSAGNRVRIAAQLIEAATGTHVWADRLEGNLNNIFALQDEITERIVVSIVLEVQASESRLARRKPLESLDAWALLQRGTTHYYFMTKDDLLPAIGHFEEAVRLDNSLAVVPALLSAARSRWVRLGYANDFYAESERCRLEAERALTLDINEPMAHAALAIPIYMAGDNETALALMATAIQLNPNFGWAYSLRAHLYYAGMADFENALADFEIALRLSPRDPFRYAFLFLKGSVLRNLGRYDEAIAACHAACQFPNAGFFPYLFLAAAYAAADRLDEAKAAIAQALSLEPKLTIAFYRASMPSKHPAAMANLAENLLKAGLPKE